MDNVKVLIDTETCELCSWPWCRVTDACRGSLCYSKEINVEAVTLPWWDEVEGMDIATWSYKPCAPGCPANVNPLA